MGDLCSHGSSQLCGIVCSHGSSQLCGTVQLLFVVCCHLINVSLFVLNTSLFVFDADRATRFVSVRLSRDSGLLGIRTAVKDANIAKHNAIMNAIARIVIVLCFDLFL